MIARQAGGVSTACRSPAHLRCARTRRRQRDLAPRAARALGVPAPMLTRAELEAREAAALAPYAMRSRDSRGRRHPEPEHPLRMAFQRDRDRIIHSTAFRRLEYKTQVFVNHEGDYYRTRLTHTIEAAQVTRTLARALGLNEDLAEAVALAHDLGHTPFGHAGERTLDRLMKPTAASTTTRRASASWTCSRTATRPSGASTSRGRCARASSSTRRATTARRCASSTPSWRRAWRRRSSTSPARSPTTRTTATTDSGRPCSTPRTWRAREEGESIPRAIADYVAGMTDRFALQEYKKLFDPEERV